ncbi:MAG: TIGR00341 family protein [Gammaproteobacteria bacterium]
MKYVEVIAESGSGDTVAAIAEKAGAHDFRRGDTDVDGMQLTRMLVDDARLQGTLDMLQNVLGAQPTARIIVFAVETTLPRPPPADAETPREAPTATRELLYEEVARGARRDPNFYLLVVLSTIVAAIGLIENNVAVVIGAMVIAPLLGPNLALSLGTALGDAALMKEAAQTLGIGIALAVGLSALFGLWWPTALDSPELLARANATLDSIVLALAAGAAAALSLTSGLSAVLVGVMVAVALLPPAATLGIMLGDGRMTLATGAGLLLAVNIVSVNLASKLVFFARGIHPRTWLEKEKARRAMLRYVLGWVVTLGVLLVLMILRAA